MLEILILILFCIAGGASGWIGVNLFPPNILEKFQSPNEAKIFATVVSTFIALLIGVFFQQLRKKLTQQNRTTPTDLLVSRSVGLILGLLVANLVLAPILLIPLPKEIFLAKPISAVLSNVFFGLLGYNLAEIHGRTFLRLLNPNSTEALLVAEGILTPACAKILDTSVIIDGRIKDLLNFGLIEGKIIVAETVIEELQQLADSSNNDTTCSQDCNDVWGGEAEDLGCGCGETGPSGCDNTCGSALVNDECGVCGGNSCYEQDCDTYPSDQFDCEGAILSLSTSIPSEFGLMQNYPNPFNPSTSISFSIPEFSMVSISIYNIHGQKIKSLVKSNMSPGYHQISWHGDDDNGISVSNGIYFYIMESSQFIHKKKMLFIK